MIIALGTRKQVGKDTMGAYLIKHYGFKRLAFADALKKETEDMLKWMGIEYEPKDEKNKERFRPLLIAYSELRRSIDQNYWLNQIIGELYDKKEEKNNWVITDMRYPNAANAIVALKPTEAIGDLIKADYTLENNDTIEDFYQKIDSLMKILSVKKVSK